MEISPSLPLPSHQAGTLQPNGRVPAAAEEDEQQRYRLIRPTADAADEL